MSLLEIFLAQRGSIVDRLQNVLNAQRKPAHRLQDRQLLTRQIEDCFYSLPSLSQEQSRAARELEDAHRAIGFAPRRVSGLYNDLISPAEMAMRAFWFWQQTRWPGRNGRESYAQTLFNLYVLRCLLFLSVRVPAGEPDAGDRLASLQRMLDRVWRTSPDGQPVFVRDARWLIPLAQSPTTDELFPYFDVAEGVADKLPPDARLAVDRAAVMTLGGHLRSQIRHYCLQENLSPDDPSVIRRTRTSNALDLALLIQGMVPLLDAYAAAARANDRDQRRELAGAILQAVSPDPELFLNRIDLLGPYSMIEHLFVSADGDRSTLSPMGERHVRLIGEYAALIARVVPALREDCAGFRPVEGQYSPYGAIFGTPTNLIEDMALRTLHDYRPGPFAIEDVFTDGDAAKRAWVSGWRKLPHIEPRVQAMYDYPQQFAEAIFARIEYALDGSAQRGAAPRGAGHGDALTGRLLIPRQDPGDRAADAAAVDDLPANFVVSSDPELVAAGRAEACDQSKLLRDRAEGYFLASCETGGGWVAVRKDLLTDLLATGASARTGALPACAGRILLSMCLGLAVTAAA